MCYWQRALAVVGALLAVAAAVGADEIAPDQTELRVLAPRNYQVFQRQSRSRGTVRINGRIRGRCDRAEARILGTSSAGLLPGRWQTIAAGRAAHSFFAELPVTPGGWYRVEVRALDGARVVAQSSADHVGVGELFLCGPPPAAPSPAAELGAYRPGRDLASALVGSDWAHLQDDAQSGASPVGAFLSAFGSALASRLRLPVGLIAVDGESASVRDWQPMGAGYRAILARALPLGPGGFRGMLWPASQPTSARLSATDYSSQLTALIEGVREEAGWEFPWFMGQAESGRLREAQVALWDAGLLEPGPDPDAATGPPNSPPAPVRDSTPDARALARIWADRIATRVGYIIR